ncbi:hypothetical protein GOV11_03645 [Candidatus Woesearchaeota archaeon]|nr:hypothetical protein [Candidatus Woesearchaeota archaeon]
MARCTFCGTEIPFGTGKMFVKKDAKILWFCSRKCEKNLLVLKRNPRNFGWTRAARQSKEQHMAEMKHEAEEVKPVKKEAPKPAPKPVAKKAPVKKAPVKEEKK